MTSWRAKITYVAHIIVLSGSALETDKTPQWWWPGLTHFGASPEAHPITLIYSWPSNNTTLNCADTHLRRFFSIKTVSSSYLGFASADSTNRGWKTVFSRSQPQFPNREPLAESRDAKSRLRLSFWGSQKLYADFQLHGGRCSCSRVNCSRYSKNKHRTVKKVHQYFKA